MVKVILATDGKKLDIAVLLKQDAKFYLDGHMAGDVVKVYLDTDNNKKTGDKLFAMDNPGYEYLIEVGACIDYGSQGTACSGGFGKTKAANFFSTYDLYKLVNGKSKERINETFNWKDRGTDIKGNRVEVSLPYSMMNLASGQSVRIVINEVDSGFSEESYIRDVLLTLK